MSKIPTDLARHALSGPTMGTRWSALYYSTAMTDPETIRAALAESVDLVDRQMSTWKADSDLMRVNQAPLDTWLSVPAALMEVLVAGLEIGRLSAGAFDIAMGDVVTAWGFGPKEEDTQAMRAALGKKHLPAYEALEINPDTRQLRKLAPLALDLSGIAKGYAVDRMMAVMRRFGIGDCLVGLDGEMRAQGTRSDGQAWTVALERPDYEKRAPLSIIALSDASVATSGDYRHWVEIGGRRLSHTMNPARGGPLTGAAASVTVLAKTCMEADAWATAFMVAGEQKSAIWAKDFGLTAIFLHRDGDAFRQVHIGNP